MYTAQGIKLGAQKELSNVVFFFQFSDNMVSFSGKSCKVL